MITIHQFSKDWQKLDHEIRYACKLDCFLYKCIAYIAIIFIEKRSVNQQQAEILLDQEIIFIQYFSVES